MFGPLVGKRFGELGQAAFGGGISGDGEAAGEGEEGRKVDYGAEFAGGFSLRGGWGLLIGRRGGSAPREQVRAKIPRQLEYGCQVDLEHLVPVAVRELVGWVPGLDACGADEDRYVWEGCAG